MTNVGETLRRERLRRGLELQEVAREIKIRPKLLEYIEEEQFDRLPGGVFAKSFVKQYAEVLGLDGEEFAAEVQRQIRPTAAPETVSRPAAPEPTVPGRVPAWESLGEQRSTSPVPSLILVVLVIIGCGIAYNWWAASQAGPATQQTATRSMPEPAVPAKPAPASLPPEPAPVQPAAQTAPDPQAPVSVTLSATEDVWVSAHSDGKYVFSGTMTAAESRTVEGTGGVRLVVGNAGGLTVNLNGKPIGPIGPRGQVRVVELTPQGFDVQTRKPPAEEPSAAIPDVL
jgi:cytoskeleton protein RodZ